MKYLTGLNLKIMGILAMGLTALLVTSCASTPMEERLENNFVYACSLDLIKKGVASDSVEEICRASHQAELLEKDQKFVHKKRSKAKSRKVRYRPAL